MVIVYINGIRHTVPNVEEFHYFLRSLKPDEYVHRENAPAIIWSDNSEEWRFKGKRHRINGPAYENRQYKEYWINGIELYPETYLKVLEWL